MYDYVIFVNDTSSGVLGEIVMYRNKFNGTSVLRFSRHRVGQKALTWWGAYICKDDYDGLRKLQKINRLNVSNALDVLQSSTNPPHILDGGTIGGLLRRIV